MWHVWDKGACRVLVEKLEGKSHCEDLGADGRITLRQVFKRQDEGMAHCECNNEVPGSKKCRQFLE
jgi:hypothetical protein